ncbi:dihydrofolate reductase family protein [Clostridium oryzae]|uniref:Bacterial bifunctional deaminase-reductase C-terminal domain-containing protein n=1 Tax=Clostridium oryzae TaxID=1450648 RepID=A0A1V4IL64_9CLOT|nr:dihydrofolate reductase family protein [Clostridium oryzae]OPJ60771.1 hypothetical protein CLORY_26390 [Clostridium oryzae]
MKKLIVSTYVSLDGIMDNPSWTVPYWNREISEFKYDELLSSDTLLLGRVTYENFAAAWPNMYDDEGFADRMNSMKKYVVSTTLKEVHWSNSSIIDENVVDKIEKLKELPGKNILVYGSAELVNTLINHRLVDEYHILVYPIVLGLGKRLFKEKTCTSLKLIKTEHFDSGVVALLYGLEKNI